MIISIASGKGGTGKTMVAVNLALAVSRECDVSFLDCDVEAPNAHIFLKPDFRDERAVSIPVPHVDKNRCTYCGDCARICHYHAIMVTNDDILLFPELCHGCAGCTLLCPQGAISEKQRTIGMIRKGATGRIAFTGGLLSVGEVLSPYVIREMKKEVRNDTITIIDSPPGTSCSVVETIKRSDYCILVTEPTPFGLNDLKITIQILEELNIPFGIIVNKASSTCDLPVEEFSANAGIEILMKIPWQREIAHRYSLGLPLVDADRTWTRQFLHLFERIEN